jgi:hypothetical protein
VRARQSPGEPKRDPTAKVDPEGWPPPSGNRASTPRLALAPNEAAGALGVSRDFFDEHVLPELRVVRRGRRRLVPIGELERWLDREAAVPLASRR